MHLFFLPDYIAVLVMMVICLRNTFSSKTDI
jgi:hypothetical protein